MLTPNPFADEELIPEPSPLDVIRTGDWLDQQHFPPVAWAVPGLIPEGFGLLTGAPKIGKSWAALGVGLSIAAGGKALGKIDVGRPRPILYLALEDGQRRLQSRARKLLGDEPIPADFHFATDTGLTPITHVIGAWLAEHGHRDPLVMLDTLGRVMPSSRSREGAYERDYRIGADLKRLTDDHPGSTLLVVHHVRKAEGADWMDSTSGTNGLNGAADFTLNLSRARNADDGLIRVTGRDVMEAEYAVTITDCTWTVDGTDLAEAARSAEARTASGGLSDDAAQIVRYVNESPEPVTPSAVAEALGMDSGKVRTYLRRAADSDRIGNPKRGVYVSVTSVTSVTYAGQSVDPVTSSVTSSVTSDESPLMDVTDVTDVTAPVVRTSPSCTDCGQPLMDVTDVTDVTAPVTGRCASCATESESRAAVLGALSATFGMDSRVLAQSVPKPHRDQTEEILAALVAEGVATVDSAGKYLKNNEESA